MSTNEKLIYSLVKEIETKYSKLEEMFNHNLILGTYREKSIIDIFKNYLSSAIEINTGFIKSTNDDTISRQLDIMFINNNKVFTTYYRDDHFVIARDDAVLNVIEVKSNFTKESLKAVKENLLSVKRINPKIRYSAFFFKTESTNEDTIKKWFKKDFVLPEDCLYIPDRISILDYGTFMFNINKKNKIILSFAKPNLDNKKDLKTQVLCDFISNTVNFCSRLVNKEKINVFEELGFGEWIRNDSFLYN